MKQFTNMNIKKESRYMTTKMIIFLLIMILSFGFAFWGTKIVEKVENSMTDMHSAIVTSTKDGENKKAYIDVTTMPYEFAISEETGTSFYIVADAEFLYIVYMNPSDFNRLNDPSIEENAIRIEGITKTISEEIKMLALEAYNDGIEEQYQISSEEFYDYFGTGSRFIKKTYIIYPSDFNCSMNILGLRPYFSLKRR